MGQEARYQVYVSNPTFTACIEEYCNENDLSDSEAFREAMREKLEREGVIDVPKEN